MTCYTVVDNDDIILDYITHYYITYYCILCYIMKCCDIHAMTHTNHINYNM